MKRLYLLIALAVAVAAVNASVFVYYPLSISLATSKPAVYFVPGSNANQNDIMYGAGNKIDVTVDSAGAQAWITIHPTYQRTYYKDVLQIKNQDNQAYYVWLIIDDPISVGGNLTAAYLHVIDLSTGTATLVKTIDLSQTGGIQIGQIPANGVWRIDLEFWMTGYTANQPGSPSQPPTIPDQSAGLRLVYTPSNETPQPLPTSQPSASRPTNLGSWPQ